MSYARNKEKMSRVANRRESISFDAILDNTNPEKLVQLIREKRGLQNAKRIFSESVSTKENNRKSFPFEVHTNNKPPVQNGCATETTNAKPIDENSSNAANALLGNVLVAKPGKNSNDGEKIDRVGVEEENGQNRVFKSRVPLKKPNNLGRRVLLKTFEQIQQEDGFHPTVVSTPVQRNPPDEEYGSIISNINRCSSDENTPKADAPTIEKGKAAEAPAKKSIEDVNTTNEMYQQQHISTHHTVADESNHAEDNLPDKSAMIHEKEKSSRKTDTIRQAKTIGESLMYQLPDVDKEIREQDDNRGRNTQFYHECIEVDETLVGNNSFHEVLNQENENQNSEIEQTLVNEVSEERPHAQIEDSAHANSPAHSHLTRPSLPPLQTTQNVNQSKVVEGPKASVNARNSKNSSVAHKSILKTNRTSQTTKPRSREPSINNASRRRVSQVVSAIASRIRNSSHLAPPSPLCTEHVYRKSNGVSFTIPPTQSPRIQVTCPSSPIVVVPIYPQSHLKSTEHQAQQATNDTQHSRVDHPKIQSEPIPHKNKKSRTSDRAPKRNSLKRKHSSARGHPNDIHQTQSPEITSDEDDIEPGDLEDTETDRHPNRRLSIEQSGVIDLRISSRRSNNHKLSLKNGLSRSRVVESVLNNSECGRFGVTLPSDSEVSLSNVLRIEDLLKRLNDSPQERNSDLNDDNPQQSKAKKVTSNKRNQSISRDESSEQISDELDENIIEHVHREDTRGGYVYDISPRLGKLYMNTMFKYGKVRESSVDTRRRPRQKSSNPVRLSQAVTYNDVESSMQRLIQYKRSGRTSRHSRRKLYSKGNSNGENSSEDETQPFESQTLINETNTTMSRAHVMDKKSKIAKCRCRPEHAKLLTIEDMKQMWCRLDDAQPAKRAKRPKNAPKMMSDDDELLFKVPHAVPIRRKVVRNIPANGYIGSNIKSILGSVQDATNIQRQHVGGGHDDSSSSAENADELPDPTSAYTENLTQVTRSTKDSSAHGAVKLSRRSQSVNRTRPETPHETQVSYQSTRTSLNTTQEKNTGDKLSAIYEVSAIEPHDCDKVESQQDFPVEPDLTRTSLHKTHSNNQSARHSKQHSKANEPGSRSRSRSKSNETLQNRSGAPSSHADSSRKSKGQISNTSQFAHNESSREGKRDLKVTPLGQQLESSPSKKSKRDIEVTPLQTDHLQDTFSTIDKETVAKKPEKKKTSSKKSVAVNDTQDNERTVEGNTADSCMTSVRRSTRKHRPPRPYWTSKHMQMEESKICYKDNFAPERKRSHRRKQRSKLPSVEEDLHGGASANVEEPQYMVDDLFNAIKEISLNKQIIPEETENPEPEPETAVQPPAKKVRKQRKPPRSVNTNKTSVDPNPASAIEEHILTDSGHGTDSNAEQNQQQQPQNVLLSWLKNLVEPTTISSNPDLVQIFHMSDVSIVPVTNLVFESLDGVEYAYYSRSSDGDNYGYMRFHPKSTKKRAKTKQFELRLLSVVGNLTLYIENEEGILKNGDFVSVPKGIRYSIVNHSDEFALLFFIKK